MILEEPPLGALRSLILFAAGDTLTAEAMEVADERALTTPLDGSSGVRLYAAGYKCPLDVLGVPKGTLDLGDETAEPLDALLPDLALEASVNDGVASGWTEIDTASSDVLRRALSRLRTDTEAGCHRFLPEWIPTAVALPDTKSDEITFLEPVSSTVAVAGTLTGRLFEVSRDGAKQFGTLTSSSAVAAFRSPNSMWIVGRGRSLHRAMPKMKFMEVIPPSSDGDPHRWAWLAGRVVTGDEVQLLLSSDSGNVYFFDSMIAGPPAWSKVQETQRDVVVEEAAVLITGGAAFAVDRTYLIGNETWALALGTPLPDTPNPPTFYELDGARVTERPLPHYPTSLTQTSFGAMVGTFVGGLLRFSQGTLEELDPGPVVLPVLAVAEYGDAILYGGTGGIFSAWHPRGGYCTPSMDAAPDIRKIAVMPGTRTVVLMSRPAIPKDLRDQTVTFLEPAGTPGDARCE